MPDQAIDEQSYRLPKTVVPDRYDITLTPDLAAGTYEGEQRVGVRNTEPVSEIVLNAVGLTFHEAWVDDVMGSRLDGTVVLEPENERARVKLAGAAGRGSWTLHLKFSGILNDKLEGFYRSTFKDAQGQERVIATTQFEATDARKAFPCWDEPDIKATFGVTLVVDKGITAISNSGVQSEEERPDGKVAIKFRDTIKMSTYLVAFIVGPLEITDPVDVDGTPLRVVHVPGKKHLTDYALEVGAFSLRFFAEYYGIKYPGDKLDLIALPDFASGAMENLGAVTFRETLLLIDRATAARGDLERVADVIAHEIAHMWFGDLVTMKWWNGLWLNEAFATFMEMLAVDAYKPDWSRWTSFGISRGAAMATDALRSTRPIEFTVRKPEEAEGMFDILTYEKGAGVLRMLEQYLGADEFKRGIAAYLKKHEYANAETTDLWDAIEQETGEPVRKIMDSWIFQGGFPLVSVETRNDGRQLAITQQRFRYIQEGQPSGWSSQWKEETPAEDGPPLWQVPVMLRLSASGRRATRKLLVSEGEFTVDLPPDVDWIVANREGSGFFRVRYTPELLKRLTADVQHVLGPVERFNLVSDTWASTLAGLTSVSDFLDMARLFGSETDRNVWLAITGGLGFLETMLEPADRPRLHAFARDLIAPAVERLGWERRGDESELTSQLRGTLVGALGSLGDDEDTKTRARELHAKLVEDRASVDRDLVPAVISVLAHSGSVDDYDVFWERYKEASTPQEEQRYLFALASFQNRDLVQRTLDACMTDAVRTQNAPFLIGSLMSNLTGGDLAWEMVKTRWDEMISRFPDNTHVRMLGGITALSRRDQVPEIREFFQSHTVKQGARTLEQHLERQSINLAFRERESATLASRF
ncbi:MAG: M1 family metallopeptidase [Chloroflexota bacterium]